jgi:hypothetical protein
VNSSTITLGAIVLLPVVVLMVLRINAALVFLSLCLGNVLVEYVAGDANSFTTLFSASHHTQTLVNNDGGFKLILLLFPVVLTAIFMIRTMKGSKLVLNVLPALGVGLLGGLLVVPLLSAGLAHNIIDSSLWAQAKRAQDIIVSASALSCLLVLWLQRPNGSGHEKHGKHHAHSG